MRCLLRLGAGAFLLAATVLLRPASAATAAHPRDAVDGEAFAAEAAGGETPATPAMRHAVTGGHAGRGTHGAHTTALTAE